MSQRSSSSSIKLKRAQETAARRAAEVRLKHLQDEAELEEEARRLEEEQRAIQRKTRLLKAQAEIAECKAREEAYEEASLLSYRRTSVTSKKSIKKTTKYGPQSCRVQPHLKQYKQQQSNRAIHTPSFSSPLSSETRNPYLQRIPPRIHKFHGGLQKHSGRCDPKSKCSTELPCAVHLRGRSGPSQELSSHGSGSRL